VERVSRCLFVTQQLSLRNEPNRIWFVKLHLHEENGRASYCKYVVKTVSQKY